MASPPSLPLVPASVAAADFAVHGARDRALFANFFRRELTTRYLGSTTGLAWALLHPIALLAVYHFVFTTVFRAGGLPLAAAPSSQKAANIERTAINGRKEYRARVPSMG